MTIDLSIVIPARNEAENLRELLPSLHRAAARLSISHEVIVVDGRSTDATVPVTTAAGGRAIAQSTLGYGNALKEGFEAARGRYVLTMDADLSHEPRFIAKLWAHREQADLVIASRYTLGGVAYMPLLRKALSRVLNRVFTWGLALDIRDISSGFRLYRAEALKGITFNGRDFDVLPEIAVRLQAAGWRIQEVPFTYFPRQEGSSQARILRVGVNLANTFLRMWRLRNSIESADYDERAFYSAVPLQRMWQRRRHRIITTFARNAGRTLDVGCGSSIILQSLNDVIGLDVRHGKMRYMKRYGIPVVTGSIFGLPFQDHAVDCVICSEVIEHVPADPVLFTELDRILKPGGLLILGTPDYATVAWPTIEWFYHRLAPGGYADEHISHYTRRGLEQLLSVMDYRIEAMRYIFRGELILAARKGSIIPHALALKPLLPKTHEPMVGSRLREDASSRNNRGGQGSGQAPVLRICMLASKFYAASDMGGGLERSARRLAQALYARGHRVYVLTRNYDRLPRREEIDGAWVERFPVWGRSRWLVSLSYLVQSLGWLIRNRKEYDLIHAHQSYAPALIAGIAKLILKKPVVVKISTSDQFGESRQLRELPFYRLRALLLHRVDKIVTINKAALEEFLQLEVASSCLLQIPNGVLIPSQAAFEMKSKQAARLRLGIDYSKVVVYAGRLSSEKNLSVLLDAWPGVLRHCPKAHLILVGDGGTFRSVEDSLRQQASRMNLESRVHFAGRVQNVEDFFLAADVFVLPSSTEGMSNALLEAMACGVAIVATRIPGNTALITDGRQGLLVEPQRSEELSTALIRLLSDSEEAMRLGQAARSLAQERFAIDRVRDQYEQLYRTLLSHA
ncbi:MAG: glycosyltransferase [Candidatus Omnitrophica bacterium]|nr:glycosyltransferase [Candidatus Omnitrophota bacterium]